MRVIPSPDGRMDLIDSQAGKTMVRLTLTIVMSGLLSFAGCHSVSPSWASRPTSRSDDPLLCTDMEKKRGADVYATTSQTRYQESVPSAALR